MHTILDNRIFEKECRSLAAAGFEVTLAALAPTADTPARQVIHGIEVIAAAKPASRLRRVTVGAYRAFRTARQRRDQIVHFHDPELIPWMLLLRLGGRQVVYDVHEDYATATERSTYLPRPIAWLVKRGWGAVAALCSRAFAIVIAERYYRRAFPNAVDVLNYPRLDDFDALLSASRPPPPPVPRLLYTGGLTLERGAMVYAELGRRVEDAEVRIVGRTAPEVAAAMHQHLTRPGALVIDGVGTQLPFSRILAAYREPWTAGLAVMPDSSHYREKELTKFFEYMAAGLPVIASNFPVWRELIEGTGVGICVDPTDPEELAAAVRRLHADPLLARSMGDAGRRAVRERFNWDSEARRLVDLYDRLIRDAR